MVHHEMFYFICVNFCDLFTCGPTLGYADPTPNCTAKELSLALVYMGPLHEAPASSLSFTWAFPGCCLTQPALETIHFILLPLLLSQLISRIWGILLSVLT